MSTVRIARVVCLALLSLLSVQCGRNAAVDRAVKAFQSREGDVRIAVVWPFASRSDGFRDGVRLAVEHVNGESGVLGRRLVATYRDDGDQADQAVTIARDLVQDPDLVAVIGHYSAEAALPASIQYHTAGVLYLSTGATEPDLTMHKFPMLLSLMPSDQGFGDAVARISTHPGFETVSRIAILNTDDKDGRSFATGVSYAVSRSERPLAILGQFSFRGVEASFVNVLSQIAPLPVDLVLLSCPDASAGRLITQARDMGINARFIGSHKLDTPRLWEVGGEHVEGTMVMSIYTPYAQDSAAIAFRDAFLRRYGVEPDPWAAIGYDAVMSLVTAMTASNSTVPALVADMMRVSKAGRGATGPISFDHYGLRESCPIHYKVMREGSFIYPQI